MNSKKILITGGTGFVGSYLYNFLQKAGYTKIYRTSLKNDDEKNKIVKIDLTDEHRTYELIKQIKPDIIFHLAAISSNALTQESFIKTIDINASIAFSVFNACLKNNLLNTKILNIGSALEYKIKDTPLKEDDPTLPITPYAISKLTQTSIAYSFYKKYNLKIIMTRSFNHIGIGQTKGFVIPDFIDQVKKCKKYIFVGNLNSYRDFTHVKDVVKAYDLLVKKGEIGEIYNVGSGKAYKIETILKWIIQEFKKTCSIKIDPKKYRKQTTKIVANIDKIKKLGFNPTIDIKNSIIEIVNFYKKKDLL